MNATRNNGPVDAILIPDEAKKKFLQSLTEDEFRDQVVRPLFRKLGYMHLRENCGPDEEGKDCIFVERDNLGRLHLVAIQTKRGPVNMAGTKPSENLNEILAQLRMALDTWVKWDQERKHDKPLKVFLCTSGKISNSAREHLLSQPDSNRITLFGDDELIEHIDKNLREIWLGVDVNRLPYLQALKKYLNDADDVIRLGEITGDPSDHSPIADGNYVQLKLSRIDSKEVRRTEEIQMKSGQVIQHKRVGYEASFIDIEIEKLPFQRARLSLVTGEGGSGKTTTLRRIAMSLLERCVSNPDALVPVLMRAKDLAGSADPLTDHISHVVRSLGKTQSPLTSIDLEKGRVVILIDAFEEIAEPLREAAIEKVCRFHEIYPECAVILTSRDYRSVLELNPLARFTHYALLPVEISHVNQLVERVASRKKVDCTIVKDTLRKLEDVHGLTLSPMLVTAFVAASDFSRQDVPPNIAEVFSKFTEQMLGRWDEKKGLEQQFEAKTKDFILRKLAFEMHRERRRYIEIDRAKQLFRDTIEGRSLLLDHNIVFDEVVVKSGLLRIEGDAIVWRHHLLQEYFAGRGVPDAEFFQAVCHDEWWRTPMVFYFGSSPEAFADLWRVVGQASSLSLRDRFDAAITIGLSIQACYLAERQGKLRTLQWVLETFGLSMTEYRRSIEKLSESVGEVLSLCAVLALGRDAIGVRLLKELPADATYGDSGSDSLFAGRDPETVTAWRIVGLLEAGEFDTAIDMARSFRSSSVDNLFMIYVSLNWVLHLKKPSAEHRKQMSIIRDRLAPGLETMRQTLNRELRSLLFEIRRGKLEGVEAPEPEAEDDGIPLLPDPGDNP